VLDRGVVLGGIERAFGDGDGRTHAADRDRAPLVSRHFGLLAGDQGGQQTFAQGEIVRFEIGGLGRGDGAGKRRRQLHAGRRHFQRGECDIGTAEEFGVGRTQFRRHASGGEALRNDERGFAGGVAQQPGALLDRQQLVDHGVLVVDGGGQRGGQFVQRGQQPRRRIQIFLRQRRTTRGLRLGDFVPEFLLLRGQALEQAVEFRHQRVLLREFDRGQQAQRIGHGGHFRIAKLAQIFVDIAGDRRVGIQQPEGRGLIGAQIMHGLEQIGRGIGDHRDAAGRLQAVPGIPGIERKSDHHAKCGCQDNGLE